MKEPVKNIAASVLARLKNEAIKQGRPFAEILQYYGMERFLFRLSKTKYASQFILKGGLLFYAWRLPLRRPTKDIDFLGKLSNRHDDLIQVINEVISAPVAADGMDFNAETLEIESMQIEAEYQGVRIKLMAQLDRSKIPIQIDIGFSDNAESEWVNYPNLLFEDEEIELKGYSKELAIAEKFHAMVHHAELNSRMKDYYDIWLLSQNFEFNSHSLGQAIKHTFHARQTEIPLERPTALTTEFALANIGLWNGFMKKTNIKNASADKFTEIIEGVWDFLKHPVEAVVSGADKHTIWMPKIGWG